MRRSERGRRLPKVIPREDWDELVDAGDVDQREERLGPRDVAMLATLFYSGLRVSEVCGLDLGDLDQAEGTVHVRHGKGDKERLAAIGAPAVAAIQDYLQVRPTPWRAKTREDGTDEAPLFVSRKGGRLDPSALWRRWKRAGAIAERDGAEGLAATHPHQARHSHATRMAAVLRANGIAFPLQEIADQLGHADLNTARIYCHLDTEERRGAADEL